MTLRAIIYDAEKQMDDEVTVEEDMEGEEAVIAIRDVRIMRPGWEVHHSQSSKEYEVNTHKNTN